MKIYYLIVLAVFLAFNTPAQAQLGGGFEGPGLSTTTAAEAAKMADNTPVVLVGNIEKSIGDEKYLFRDKSGTIVIEIDDDDWRGLTVKPEHTVEIKGEVDKEVFQNAIIDVDVISIK